MGKEVAAKRVRYQDLTIKPYQFTDEDRDGYYKNVIEEFEAEKYKNLTDTPDTLVDFDTNRSTGHQFIRAVSTNKFHLNSIKFM